MEAQPMTAETRQAGRMVPKGDVVQGNLRASYIRLGEVLKHLQSEGFDGYVRLKTSAGRSVIFWEGGQALECWHDTDEASTLGAAAVASFEDGLAEPGSTLDIVRLRSEVVAGLVGAKVRYTEMYTDWVRWEALVDFFKARGWSGNISIQDDAAAALVVLSKGEVVGTWLNGEESAADAVAQAANEPGRQIEIREVDNWAFLDLGALAKETWEVQAGMRKDPGLGGGELSPPWILEADEALGPAWILPEPTVAEATPEEAPTEPTVAEAAEETAPATEEAAPAAEEPPAAVEEPVVSPETTEVMATEPAPVEPEVVVEPEEPKVVVDWPKLVAELDVLAEETFGNRSRKVRELLNNAPATAEGVKAAIDSVPHVSLLFVDGSRLEKLAGEMRSRVAAAETGA